MFIVNVLGVRHSAKSSHIYTISSTLTCFTAPHIAGSSYMADVEGLNQNKVQMRIIHLLATMNSHFLYA